jgi:hypothetical protein
MNELWFAGDPNQFLDLTKTKSLAYDDHRFDLFLPTSTLIGT